MSKTTPTMTHQVLRRQHITTERKKLIIEASAAMTLTELANKFQIPRSTCQSILRNKKAILEAIENGIGLKRARLTKGRNTNFDSALLVWVRNVRDQNILLTPSILREKALELAAEMKVDGFQASNGWLDRFQDRNGVILHRVQNENNELREETIKAWQQSVLHKALSQFDPDDVFSLDETEIYWQINSNKNAKEDNGKQIKDRITILFCSNMNGTEKLPLLVIGRTDKLETFEQENVLITYTSNEKAWMNANIFIDWLNEWDKKLQDTNRKILLYVDRCQAHPKVKLQNIKLKFFLPKMCSSMQPMQGLIQSYKLQYRRMLPQPDQTLSALSTPQEINISLPAALFVLHQAWEQVASATISNCFRKAEFIPRTNIQTSDRMEESESEDEEFFAETLEKPNETTQDNTMDSFADYGDLNEEFSTSNAFILAEIEKACAKSEHVDEVKKEVPKNGTNKAKKEVSPVNVNDALLAFGTVRKYVQQNSNDQNFLTICDVLGAFLEMHK